MGHQQQSAGVAGPALTQVSGQPGDAFDVEVVGRLVQRDDIPVVDQQHGQLDSSPLATAECANCRVPADVGNQAADHVADAWITGPLMLGLLADQGPTHCAARVEGVRLAQRPDAQAAAPGDPSGIWAHLTGEQTQQTGFAVAVSSHDADAVAVADPNGHRLEDDLSRVLQVHCLGPQQVCHRLDPSPPTMHAA